MNEKQTSKSIKKINKSLRNVLALPKKFNWPLLPERDDENLQVLLKKALLLINMENGTKTDEEKEKILQLRKDLRIGVNDVSRAIENKSLSSCLVAGEVKPKILVSHIVTAAGAARVPCLVLNGLKAVSKESAGFSAMAIGFKKTILENPKHTLFELCSEILKLEKKVEDELSTTVEEDEESSENSGDEATDEMPKSDNFNNTEESNKQDKISLENIYLYRDSTTYRVFRPNDLINEENSVEETSENLPFGNYVPEKTGSFTSRNSYNDGNARKKMRYYDPPTILRVQPNPKKVRKRKKKNTKK